MRGVEAPSLAWTDEVLTGLAHSALLGYLAVAHYGRGRGDWAEAEQPDFWHDAVSQVLQPRAELLAALWSAREGGDDPEDVQHLRAQLQALLSDGSRELLLRLYPAAGDAIGAAGSDGIARRGGSPARPVA
ncbi:hypothetical protein X551_03917 [Methylibium sp. T29]|nr:hypothetical protein X551_03917 [Methylibium sp. T29]EWS58779.1 hypothetical protein Y694_03352 [Methylibium sp. T29-B]